MAPDKLDEAARVARRRPRLEPVHHAPGKAVLPEDVLSAGRGARLLYAPPAVPVAPKRSPKSAHDWLYRGRRYDDPSTWGPA